MNKLLFIRVTYFILQIPVIFTAVFLTSSLFYLCLNEKILGIILIVSGFISLLLAKRVTERNSAIIRMLVLTVFVLLFLALVVLPSLNSARNATPSASIKQSIGNMRSQAEMSYNSNGLSYDKVCDDPMLTQLKEAVSINQIEDSKRCLGPITKMILPIGDTSSWFTCNSTGVSYVVEAYIPSKESYFCVDSKGNMIEREGSIGVSTSCQ